MRLPDQLQRLTAAAMELRQQETAVHWQPSRQVPQQLHYEAFPIYGVVHSREPPGTLHEAAEQGAVSTIHRLVAKNIELDINKGDRLGRTAMHWAVDMAQVDAVEALLDYGAKPFLSDGVGRTPVHLAAKHGHTSILRRLFKDVEPEDLVAAVNAVDNHGLTPAFLAAQRGDDDRETLQLLIATGAKYS